MSKQEKQKIDFGKGFKRIYYVLTAIYFFYIFIKAIDYYNKCAPTTYKNYSYPLYCSDLTLMSQLSDILIIILIPIAIYYFLKWIILGFKK